MAEFVHDDPLSRLQHAVQRMHSQMVTGLETVFERPDDAVVESAQIAADVRGIRDEIDLLTAEVHEFIIGTMIDADALEREEAQARAELLDAIDRAGTFVDRASFVRVYTE